MKKTYKWFILMLLGITNLFGYSGYYAPYKAETTQKVSQNYDGTLSHYGAGLGYALDFSGQFDVYPPKDGVVEKVGTDSYKISYCVNNPQHWHGPANYIRIRHSDGVYSYYYHLETISVKEGDFVKRGKTILGVSGNTGCSTANHLHFQFSKYANMKRVNSLKISLEDIGIPSSGTYYTSKNYPLLSGLTRAKALKLILNKFEISTINEGFNQSRFSEPISLPSDVTNSTDNYDAIVVGYNRGITNGSNGKFNPTNAVSLQEFLTMIVRAIPIPLNNPNYKEYSYMSSSDGFYKNIKTAYNADIIENKEYDFAGGIDEDNAKELLDKAFEYFRGAKSGISVYLKWNEKYADLDMYAFSEADAGGIQMNIDSNRIVTNMSELRTSGAIVYWNKYSSAWGTNLDYDSWGGNGGQPWSGFGEERITVDSLMARRPGTYSFIICNYDWGNSSAPSSPNYELIGYQGATNITSGGTIKGTISKSKCVLGGTLSTN